MIKTKIAYLANLREYGLGLCLSLCKTYNNARCGLRAIDDRKLNSNQKRNTHKSRSWNFVSIFIVYCLSVGRETVWSLWVFVVLPICNGLVQNETHSMDKYYYNYTIYLSCSIPSIVLSNFETMKLCCLILWILVYMAFICIWKYSIKCISTSHLLHDDILPLLLLLLLFFYIYNILATRKKWKTNPSWTFSCLFSRKHGYCYARMC